jgi:hypothetical protein
MDRLDDYSAGSSGNRGCAVRPIAKECFRGLGDYKMRIIGIVTFAAAAALSCVSGLAQNSPVYMPSNDYRTLTCPQLAQEGRAISKRGFMLSGLKAGLGGSEGTEAAPAIVIVWPVTSPHGDKRQSENLTQADKQMDAIEQASVESQCSIRFQRPPKS